MNIKIRTILGIEAINCKLFSMYSYKCTFLEIYFN